MRALKLTGIALGVLVALLALLLIGVRLFVNPNDFRGRIEKAVKDQTGRELHLSGDIKLQGLAKARVQQELDKHKGELQQRLLDQLKGLFNK